MFSDVIIKFYNQIADCSTLFSRDAVGTPVGKGFHIFVYKSVSCYLFCVVMICVVYNTHILSFIKFVCR